LEIIADEQYTLDLRYTDPQEFGALLDEQGNPFGGIESTDGTWVLALLCAGCYNPAPKYLTILEPCP
jgi:hypothetical protein